VNKTLQKSIPMASISREAAVALIDASLVA
jgi:hypothetical protein